MKKLPAFVGFWILNSLVLYVLSLILGELMVFGNANVSALVAIIFTGFLLTAITYLTQPVAAQLKIKITNENNLTVVYLIVNIVAVWILARVAAVTGFGIAIFWVAIVSGVILTSLQWVFWKFAVPLLKKK